MIQNVTSEKALQEFESTHPLAVLMILKSDFKEKDHVVRLNSVVLNYPQARFGFTKVEEIRKKFNIGATFGFVFFRKFGDGNHTLELEKLDNFRKFKKFFELVRHPPVLWFT